MDDQIEAAAFKGKAGHVLIGKAINLDAELVAGNVSRFDQPICFGHRPAEIVRLIQVEDVKALEFRLDSFEAPEQHPNALRHLTGSTKLSFPLVEPTSFATTQSPSLRQFIVDDGLWPESLTLAVDTAVPVDSAPTEDFFHEGKTIALRPPTFVILRLSHCVDPLLTRGLLT